MKMFIHSGLKLQLHSLHVYELWTMSEICDKKSSSVFGTCEHFHNFHYCNKEITINSSYCRAIIKTFIFFN